MMVPEQHDDDDDDADDDDNEDHEYDDDDDHDHKHQMIFRWSLDDYQMIFRCSCKMIIRWSLDGIQIGKWSNDNEQNIIWKG